MKKKEINVTVDKSKYLVTGRIGLITQERIRQKIRYLLNNYTKCIIGKSSDPENNRKSDYKSLGYKYLFYVYKSTRKESVEFFESHFNTLYEGQTENLKEGSAGKLSDDSNEHFLYVAAKNKRIKIVVKTKKKKS